MSRGNDSGAILGSLILGALAGAVAALLLAPQTGKETRGQLIDEADKLREELEKYANDFSELAKEKKAELQDKLKQTEAELKNYEEELGV